MNISSRFFSLTLPIKVLYILFSAPLFCSLQLNAVNTEVSGSTNVFYAPTDLGLRNDYPPSTDKFTESFNDSLDYMNKAWLKMSHTDQANYIFDKYTNLLIAHSQIKFSPELLTCKAFRESMTPCQVKYKGKSIRQRGCRPPKRDFLISKKFFNPQIDSPKSSARGLGQVLKGTAIDLFNRGKWFHSKVYGYESITDGKTFYNKMSGNMIAQMEIGMAVLHQKKIDKNCSSDECTLRGYYGSGNTISEGIYATRILCCEKCTKKSKSGSKVEFSDRCLGKALGESDQCS